MIFIETVLVDFINMKTTLHLNAQAKFNYSKCLFLYFKKLIYKNKKGHRSVLFKIISYTVTRILHKIQSNALNFAHGVI